MQFPGGIYMNWFYFRRGKIGGQVATMITLAIAVIFLFIAVTLNISRVAERKTMTANAADGAAVRLASYLGSWGNQLSWNYLDGKASKKGKKNWGAGWALLTLPFTWGTPLMGLSVASYGYQALIKPELTRVNMQKEFNKLLPEDNIVEQAIHYAFLNSVDDPVKVADVHDYDKDGEVTDEISRFDKFYFERVKLLGEQAEEIRTAKKGRIDGFLNQWESFVDNGSTFRENHLGSGGKLVSLLEDVELESIDLSFWQPGPTLQEVQAWKDADEQGPAPQGWDEVDSLDNELTEFNTFFNDVNNSPCDWIIDTNNWLPNLYTEEETEPDDIIWYNNWVARNSSINSWKQELNTAYAALGEMVEEKEAEIVLLEEDIQVKKAQILILEQDIANKTAEISVLQGEINLKKGDIAGKEAEILALQGEIAAKQTEILGLEEEIEEKETEINTKKSEIAVLQGEIAVKNSEIAVLQGEIATKQAEITALENEIAANEGNITAKQAQISALQGSIAAKQAEIAALNNEITAKESQIAAKEADIASLEAYIAEHYDDVDNIFIDIAALQAIIAQLQTQIAALEQEIVNKENAVATKQAEIATMNTTIATKQAEIAALNSEITTKEGSIAVKEGEITAKESSISVKEGQITAKQNTITAKQGEISGLEDVVYEKEVEVSVLENDITRKQGDVTARQGDIAVLQGEITAKEGEIGIAQGEIDTKTIELSGLEDEVVAKLEKVEELKKDIARIQDLQKRIVVAVNDLGSFQGRISAVSSDIQGFYCQNQTVEKYEDEPADGFYNTFKDGVFGQFPGWVEDIFDKIDDFGSLLFGTKEVKGDYTVAPRWVVYSWRDSLGWHHVLVEVSGFHKPWIRVKAKRTLLYSRQKLYLEDAVGEITVKITRYDQATASSFAGGAVPLWKFRYGMKAAEAEEINHANPLEALVYDVNSPNGCKYAVTSSSTVGYTFNQLPNVVRVE